MKRLFKHLTLGLSLAAVSTACIAEGERLRIDQTGSELGPDGLPGTADDLAPDPTDDPAVVAPATEPESDPAGDPTLEPDPEPTGDPAVEPEPEPGTDPGTDPGLEPGSDPVTPEPAEDTPRVVLLLPGTSIGGDSFEVMAERLVDDGFVPVVYEPADLFTGSLAQGAEDVAAIVETLKEDYDVPSIDIVGQCDGGVVARYYLTLLDGAPNVGRLVTLVAPHHGSDLSGVGAWLTGWQALEDVRPGSAFMEALNSVPLPSGVDMTSIYSCHDELMVPYTTSIVAGATNVEFCDHYLKHLAAFDDDLVYERLRMSLDGVPGAPTAY